jgi:O-antigen ligase
VIYFILFFIAFAGLAWKRIDLALMLVIAGLPLYLVRFKIFNTPFTMLEAMILIAFFVWFVFQTHFKDFICGHYGVKEFFKNSPFVKKETTSSRKFYPLGIEIILLLIISFVAVGVSKFSLEALGIWKAYFFEPVLLYILILNVFKNKDDFKKIILPLAFSILIVSVYAIWQKVTGLGIDNSLWAAAETRRVVSFFGYPNAVGLYLAPIIMILVAFLFVPSKKELSKQETQLFFPLKKENISQLGLSKGFLLLIIVCSSLAIYFAHSEGAIVGLVAGLFIFGLLGNKKTRLVVLAGVITCIIALVIISGAGKTVVEKATLKDFSGQVRRAQWDETWKMLKNNNRWIFGAGLANYQKAIVPYHVPGIFYDDGTDPDFRLHVVFNDEYKKQVWRPVEIYLYPHNIILNFWSELGLAGVLLFIFIFIKIIYHLLFIIYHSGQAKNKQVLFLAIGLLCVVVVIAVHGLVDVPYFKNDLACLFWVLVAIFVLLDLDYKKKNV